MTSQESALLEQGTAEGEETSMAAGETTAPEEAAPVARQASPQPVEAAPEARQASPQPVEATPEARQASPQPVEAAQANLDPPSPPKLEHLPTERPAVSDYHHANLKVSQLPCALAGAGLYVRGNASLF